jgi:hypothetical protein
VAFFDVWWQVKFWNLEDHIYPMRQLQVIWHQPCAFPKIAAPLASNIIARDDREQYDADNA